ncbi:MAG: GAF domain-containing protein [Vulcanimicrobiota bacterium]
MPKRIQVLEILAIYAVIGLFGWQYNAGDWAFIGVTFHPYLAVIIIVGSLRGSSQSLTLTSSLLATLLYLIGLMQIPVPPSLSGLPILAFVITGVVLGLGQRASRRKLQAFRFHLKESFLSRDQLRRSVGALECTNETLNHQVQGQLVTPYSFSEIARRLSLLDERDLYQEMCTAVCEYIHAEVASFYLLTEDGNFKEVARMGSRNHPFPVADKTEEQPLVKLAQTTRAAVTRLDLGIHAMDKSTAKKCLMCAPLLHKQTGATMGVLCVDKMPFARFNNVSKRSLRALADFSAGALANARERRALREEVGLS